jgi:hypothetical protein
MKIMLFILCCIPCVCFSQNNLSDTQIRREVDYTEVIHLFATEAENYLQKQANNQPDPHQAMNRLLEKRNRLTEKLILTLGETEQEKRINFYYVVGLINGAYQKTFPDFPEEFYDKVQKKIRKF